jgi:hypothetical protein
MPSRTYDLFAEAMADRKQILCTYDGYPRELCPIVLGHSREEEKALTYQFGGRSSKGLPPGGQWRCLFWPKLATPGCEKGRGTPAIATASRRAASKSSISMSTRRARITQNAACRFDDATDRQLQRWSGQRES